MDTYFYRQVHNMEYVKHPDHSYFVMLDLVKCILHNGMLGNLFEKKNTTNHKALQYLVCLIC